MRMSAPEEELVNWNNLGSRQHLITKALVSITRWYRRHASNMAIEGESHPARASLSPDTWVARMVVVHKDKRLPLRGFLILYTMVARQTNVIWWVFGLFDSYHQT